MFHRSVAPLGLVGLLLSCGQKEKISTHSHPSQDMDTAISSDTGDCAPSPWYADEDVDGYGDATKSILVCEQPAGYVSNNTDCDDNLCTVNPGAEEICGDGLDNNCDDSANACELSGTYSLTYWGDSDADVSFIGRPSTLTGYAVAFADSDGDGDDDIFISTPSAGESGGAYFLSSPYSGNRLELLAPDDADDAGISIAGVHDLDGDGYEDAALGALSAQFDEKENAGNVFFVSGPLYATNEILVLGEKDAQRGGEAAGDFAGNSVAGVGDINNDGYADVLVGAYTESSGMYKEGAAYLLNGPISGITDLSTANAKLIGENQQDVAGSSVAAGGDVNGDGNNDLLVGAYGNDYGGSYAGAAYLVYGPVNGTKSLSTADARLFGGTLYAEAGYAVAGGGDVNNDGYDDILVGAPENDYGGSYAGAAHLVLGPVPGDLSLACATATFIGDSQGNAGRALSLAGDIDNDGLEDILIGAPYYNNEYDSDKNGGDELRPDAGRVSLFYAHEGSSFSGMYLLSDADASFIGGGNDYVGFSVASNGDANNDGYADILIGAIGVDTSANSGTELENSAGAAYLFYGNGW